MKALKEEKINKVSLIAFTENDIETHFGIQSDGRSVWI